MKRLTLYHGTSRKFERFDPATTGQGADQEGPGFYLTDDRNDAWKYGMKDGDCHVIVTVELVLTGKLIEPREPTRLSLVRQLIKWAPDLDETLKDWDEIPFVAMTRLTASAMCYPAIDRAFQDVWYSCYRQAPAQYLDSLVKLGFVGHVVRHSKVLNHYVVYDPLALQIQKVENLDDDGHEK